MLKLLCVLSVTVFSLSAQASLLKCVSNTGNVYYDFQIDNRSVDTQMFGSLSHVSVGFASTDTRFLGRDPLKVTLNPSSCEMTITSQFNSANELLFTIPLYNVDISETNFAGRISGSLVDASAITCNPSDSDLIRSLQAVCSANPNLDTNITFRKSYDVIRYLASGDRSVNDQIVIEENSSSPHRQGGSPIATPY